MSSLDEVDAYIAGLEDASGIVEVLTELFLPTCYISDCTNAATYRVHSYPDDVRLCDQHKSLHPVEVHETLCTGTACRICGPVSGGNT